MSDVNNEPTTPVRRTSSSREAQEVIEIPTSSPLSDPPSSPPVFNAEMARSDNMPPPAQPASAINCKRSREKVVAETDRDSSVTFIESSASQGKNADGSITSTASSSADLEYLQSQKSNQQMITPDSTPTPVTKPAQPNPGTIQQPRSKASDAKKRKAAESADKQKVEEIQPEEQSDDGSQGSNESEFSAPEDRIAPFDWRDLQERYHERMNQLRRQEQSLNNEWLALHETFEIWALAGNEHEVDRSFKRLKTQSFFVRHEENQLEQKREHYKKVVQAFQTVENLLDAPEWSKQFNSGSRLSSKGRKIPPLDINTATSKRDARTAPLIVLEDWAADVVDDIDIKTCPLPGYHPSRCVIL